MTRASVVAVLVVTLLAALPAGAAEIFAHGRIPAIVLHAPPHSVARFVILLSDRDGWTAAMDRLAATLAADGTLVAGLDTARLLAAVAADGDEVNVVGDFENLAHVVQGYRRLPAYFVPVLAGVGSGATLAQTTFAQARSGLFAGLVTLDLCTAGTRGGTGAWRALQRPGHCPAAPSAAQIEEIAEAAAPAALRDAVRTLAPVAATPPPTPGGLPLVEVPSTRDGTRYAILMSGDGGWAGLDEALASTLAAAGLPVVGFDSLRYFWSARTPQGLAADLDRLIRAYAGRWHRSEVVLIGYSQGADVLPFAINRLPPTTRRLVSHLVLLGPGARASFEFHLDDWLRRAADGLPLAPELARLSARELVCVYGRDDTDTVCPHLPPGNARIVALPGDHHFDGDYASLATRVLAALAQPDSPAAPGRPSAGGVAQH